MDASEKLELCGKVICFRPEKEEWDEFLENERSRK